MIFQKKQMKKGFSVVEFIVIISIFGIMSSVVFFDFNGFSRQIDRNNLATDVALAFRKMQVFGISASDQGIGSAGFSNSQINEALASNLTATDARYGVEINFSQQTITQYQKGDNSSNIYTSSSDTLIDVLTVTGQNRILRVCVVNDGNVPRIRRSNATCSFVNPSNGDEIDDDEIVGVTFRRPYPDALVYGNDLSLVSPNIMIIVVGIPGGTAEEASYIYVDSIGLIQVTEPTLID